MCKRGLRLRNTRRSFSTSTKEHSYQVVDRVMVYMPHKTSGKQRKLALPYHGPYRILDVSSNGISVRLVDHPEQEPIRVNIDQVTKCPTELLDVSWLGNTRKRPTRKRNRAPKSVTTVPPTHSYYLRRNSSLKVN